MKMSARLFTVALRMFRFIAVHCINVWSFYDVLLFSTPVGVDIHVVRSLLHKSAVYCTIDRTSRQIFSCTWEGGIQISRASESLRGSMKFRLIDDTFVGRRASGYHHRKSSPYGDRWAFLLSVFSF